MKKYLDGIYVTIYGDHQLLLTATFHNMDDVNATVKTMSFNHELNSVEIKLKWNIT